MTAVAALILVERCLLRLDEPVDRLLPELAGRRVLRRLDGPLDDTVPAERPITVRDLLAFTMGFGLVMAAPDAVPLLKAALELGVAVGPPAPATTPAPDEFMRGLGSLPLAYQPGERWLYSTGSDVLGVLIARAAGVPFEQFLSDEIFAPLGMADTAFSVPPAKLDRFGACYGTDPASGAAVVYDPRRRTVEPSAGLSVGGRRPGLDRRRLPGLRPDAARPRSRRRRPCRRADPLTARGRAHDERPAHAGAEGPRRARSRASSRLTAGGSAWPSTRDATTWPAGPAATAGMAAWAPPGAPIRRRR